MKTPAGGAHLLRHYDECCELDVSGGKVQRSSISKNFIVILARRRGKTHSELIRLTHYAPWNLVVRRKQNVLYTLLSYSFLLLSLALDPSLGNLLLWALVYSFSTSFDL
jgi:hypothetical protein